MNKTTKIAKNDITYLATPASALALHLPADMPFDEWIGVGRSLADRRRNLDWMIGDWFVHGQTHHAEQLKLALPEITDDPKFLTRAAKIAEAFPEATRDASLSFRHHEHVADLPADEAQTLLAKAKANHWPARKVRLEAMNRKVELGQTQIFADDDFAYNEMMALSRAWNRARPSVRSEFLEMATEAGGGVIDP